MLFFAIVIQLLASGLVFSSSKEIQDSEDTKYGCMAAIVGFLPVIPTIFFIWGLVESRIQVARLDGIANEQSLLD